MTQLTDKPSLDEAMAHYGVMGMQWGKHSRAQAGGSEIRSARRRVGINREAYRTEKSAVKTTAKGSEARAKAEKHLAATKLTMLKNPDRVIAARMTKGEKTAGILLLQGGLGIVAVTSIRSRRIEYKQQNSQYK